MLSVSSCAAHFIRITRTVWRERPRFFNNPIILREFVAQLRKKQSFVYLFIFAAIGSVTFILWWNDYVRRNSWYYNPQSRDLLMYIAIVEGIVILVFSPLISAVAVNIEKERMTWDLLRTTPINLLSILLGKFLTSIFFVWIIMLSLLPVFSLTLPIGGVSPREITAIYAVFTEGMIIASLIGLYCSTRWKRTLQSISFSYIFCFIYFFAVPIIPLIFMHGVTVSYLSSPVIVGVFALMQPGELGQAFRMTDLQALYVHFFIIGSVILTLMGMCFFQLQPAATARAKAFFQRLWMGLGFCCRNVYILTFLTLSVWLLLVVIQRDQLSFSMQNIPMEVLRADFLSQFLTVIGCLALSLFPFAFTTYYQAQRENPSWHEAALTPKQLRRFLVGMLKGPLFVYLKWIAVLGFFLVWFFLVHAIYLVQTIWALFFLGEAVLMTAAISMACSLITRGLFLSTLYSYGIAFLVFVFIPVLLWPLDDFCGPACSPLFLASLPFYSIPWKHPFSAFASDEAASGLLSVHIIFLLLFFVTILLFCERRALSIAGTLVKESMGRWLRRTLFNQSLRQKLNPQDDASTVFPDKLNIVAVKEWREYLLYRRKTLTANLIWLFISSALIFIVLPILNYRFYRNFFSSSIEFPIVVLSMILPFFVIPYAANSFRKEHDQSTWEVLSTVTLSPWKLLNGKLLASFVIFNLRFWAFLLPILFLTYGLYYFDGRIRHRTIDLFYASLMCFYPFSLFIIMAATFFSVRVKKTTTAYIASLLTVYFFLASPIFLMMAGIRIQELAAILSPIYLLTSYRQDYFHPAIGAQIFWEMSLSVLLYFAGWHSIRKSLNQD
ncbi:MAG: hypothetical protein JXR73_07785 [Candidatus Omnitrophica bacterium]|nr:hypothetical protein [Candidatus Omnitrophota bacterium]